MANLTETANYDAAIPQLETTTPALAGPGGPMNAQAQALANRTAFLKAQVEGKVAKSGDSMSGDLTIAKASPFLTLDHTAHTQRGVRARTNGVAAWDMLVANDTGGDMSALRYSDAGALLGTAWGVNRLSGTFTIGYAPTSQNAARVIIRTPSTASEENAVILQNTVSAAWSSVGILFQTGLGETRGRVRGQRENSTSNGRLVFTTFAGATEKEVLTLGSDKTATFTGDVYAVKLRGGGSGDAGVLKCRGSVNTMEFRWNGTYSLVSAIIDDGGYETILATATNAKELGLTSVGSGPTGVALHLADNGGSWFGIYTDYTSDQRIKQNIRDTEVDALSTLRAIPVRSYEVKADAALHFASVGKTEEEKASLAADPQPAPVAIGLVAQEVSPHIPEMVVVHGFPVPKDGPLPEGMQTIAHQNSLPYLIRAIQQMADRIEALEAALAAQGA